MEFKSFTVNSPAKINLCLHITGRTENNYHLISSLVGFSEFGDKITFSKADEFKLEFTGTYAKEMQQLKIEDNLITRAIKLYFASPPPIKIILQKNMPLAAGIGGGSSNAATSIKILKKLFNINIKPDKLLQLGADIPVCLFGKSAIVEAIGEKITAVKIAKLNILLVNPNIEVKTKEIFSHFSRNPLYNKTLDKNIDISNLKNLIIYLKNSKNQLQESAITFVPIIKNVIEEISASNGCIFARMSGSGATCFGIFDKEPNLKQAKLKIMQKYPNWWVKSTYII